MHRSINGSAMYAGEPRTDTGNWPTQSFSPDDVPMMVPDIELLEGPIPWPRPKNDGEIRQKVFDAMITQVDLIGGEELRGSPVNHFKVRLDRDQARPKLPPELSAAAGAGTLTLDLWIDPQGRLRKLQTKMRFFELWDFDNIPAAQLPKNRLPA